MTEAKHAMTPRFAAPGFAAPGFAVHAAAGLLLGLALAGGPVAAARAQEAPPDVPAAPAAAAEPAASGTAAQPSGDSATPTAAGEAAPAETAGEAAPAKAAGPLLIASWGGVYSRSQEEAIYRPFTRTTGIEITRKVYAGGLDDLRGQLTSRQMVWDVVDIEPADAEEGCNEGLLLKLDLDLPPAPDGTPAEEDFLPGTLHPCAVGSLAWSVALAYSDSSGEIRADDVKPTSLQDFFDLERFPGRRGLRRTPMVNLEWALLADGVAAGEVYDLLGTDAGVARAFAKLDTIRDEIVWWEDAAEPARLLASGRVAMTSTFNAPMFDDIVVRQQPFAMIWDRQVWDIDLWAVPTIAPNREAALAFVRFATSTEPLARQTRWISYGPVRRSALAQVGSYVHADVEMARYLPTTEENFETALRNDAQFWHDHGPALVERFNAWLTR
jgi:putative spermidine/putrescine transport system substrate-binding protein